MSAKISTKLAGKMVPVTGGSRDIGAAIVKFLADEAAVASVFVTNGGYNGVQQVLRLSTPLSQKPHRTNCDEGLSQNSEND
jgi:NAD(P)-dependent dehydrogenase (short-subunit alcohol dehydrogenase family)